jgi:hypothetical protein
VIPVKPEQAGPRTIGPSKIEVILVNTLFYGAMLGSLVMLMLGFMTIVG